MLSTTTKKQYSFLKKECFRISPRIYYQILNNPSVCSHCGKVEDFDDIFLYTDSEGNEICFDCHIFEKGIDSFMR